MVNKRGDRTQTESPAMSGSEIKSVTNPCPRCGGPRPRRDFGACCACVCKAIKEAEAIYRKAMAQLLEAKS